MSLFMNSGVRARVWVMSFSGDRNAQLFLESPDLIRPQVMSLLDAKMLSVAGCYFWNRLGSYLINPIGSRAFPPPR